jgi:hypothetical protein
MDLIPQLILKDIAFLRKDMEALLISSKELDQSFKNEIKQIRENYVSHKEFLPVKSIVYGAVGLILSGVITALVALVLTK